MRHQFLLVPSNQARAKKPFREGCGCDSSFHLMQTHKLDLYPLQAPKKSKSVNLILTGDSDIGGIAFYRRLEKH
jgi:hypothetical protein